MTTQRRLDDDATEARRGRNGGSTVLLEVVGEGPMLSRADLKPVVGHWNLVGYSSEGVFVSVEGRLGKEMFIDLEDDGKMSGTICNELSGSFSCVKDQSQKKIGDSNFEENPGRHTKLGDGSKWKLGD